MSYKCENLLLENINNSILGGKSKSTPSQHSVTDYFSVPAYTVVIIFLKCM